MEELLGDLWPVLGAVLLVAVLGGSWWVRKKKQDRLRAEAEQRGWTYRASGRALTHRFVGPPFHRGRQARSMRTGRGREDPRTKAVHVLEGEHRGRRLLAFEYRYRTERPSRTRRRTSSGSRGRREGVYETVKHRVVVVSPRRPLPPFFLERRGLKDTIAQAFGVGPAGTGDDEFDEKFSVGGAAPEQLRAILTRDVRTWLLHDERADRRRVRVEDGDVLTFTPHELTVSRVAKDADYLVELLDQIEAADRTP